MPQVGLAKALTGAPTNNGDGTYTLEYTLVSVNTGDTPLSNVTTSDNLATAFGTVPFTVDSDVDDCQGTTLAPSVPAGSGDSCDRVITVTITPGSNFGPYENTATVSGETPSGVLAIDDSVGGADADADGDGDPTNGASPTVAMVGENPQVGLAKALSADPVDNGDGSFTLEYGLIASNTGDVALSNLTIDDDLAAAFAGATFTPTIVADCNATVLAVGADCTHVISVHVVPNGNLGPFENTATVSGTSPGGTVVADDSVDGADPDADGDGDPTNDASPTIAVLTEMPQIGLAKALTGGPTSNGDGTYSLEYTLIATNTGNVPLTDVTIDDDLASAFAGAGAWSSTTASDTCSATSNPITPLAVGGTCAQMITVAITPGDFFGPYENTATVSGTSPGGAVVADDSVDGATADADADGDSDPTNDASPTVAMIGENPQVGLAKALTGGPTSNGDGTYTLEYTLIASNTGNTTLSNVTINDDLESAFAGLSYTATPSSDGCAGVTLALGASCTLVLSVGLTAADGLGPFENTATVSGTSPNGVLATDDSVDGGTADADGDGDPTNDASPTLASLPDEPSTVEPDQGQGIVAVTPTPPLSSPAITNPPASPAVAAPLEPPAELALTGPNQTAVFMLLGVSLLAAGAMITRWSQTQLVARKEEG